MDEPASTPPHFFHNRPRTLAVLGLLIALLAFGRSASNDFVEWDDAAMLTTNPKMNPPTWSSVFSYALPRNAQMGLYIPLTEFCWGGLSALAYVNDADPNGAHLNPWVFHSASIGVHLFNTLLVFLCLRQMLALMSDDDLSWPAWVGAMVFAVHPLQMQAVAWACGLKDLLSGTFVIGCVYCFIRYRTEELSVRDGASARPWTWYGVALGCCVAANLAKAGAVATPLGILLIDCLILRSSLRRSLAVLWPWFAASIPVVVIARATQQFGWKDIPTVSIWLRPFVAGDALAFYIEKLFIPIRLSFDYQRTPDVVLKHWTTYLIWIVPVAGLLTCLWVEKRQRLPLTGLLFSLVSLLPVLGLVPFGSQEFSTVADRYLYVPMLGISMLVAWIATRLAGNKSALGVFAVLISLAVLTEQSSLNWSDNEHLCQQAVAVNPNAWNPLYGLGLIRDNRGDLTEAEYYYRRSLQVFPRNGRVIRSLGMLYIRQGRLNEALLQMRDLTHYYQLQKNSDPDTVEKANLAIAMIMFKKQRFPEAIEACQNALSIEPGESHAMQVLQESRDALSHLATQPVTQPATRT